MTSLMRVRTVFTYGSGDPGLMTNYFRYSPIGPVGTAAQDSVNRVRDALNTFPTLWPVGWVSTVSGDVDILDDATGNVTGAEAAAPAVVNGTAGGVLGPLAVGVLLRLRTDSFVSGRRLIGRTFFVPIGAPNVGAPKVSAALQGLVTSIGTALMNAGTTGVFPVIWSRPRPATPVDAHHPAGPARAARAGSSSDVTGASCSPNYVVLRSRRD